MHTDENAQERIQKLRKQNHGAHVKVTVIFFLLLEGLIIYFYCHGTQEGSLNVSDKHHGKFYL